MCRLIIYITLINLHNYRFFLIFYYIPCRIDPTYASTFDLAMAEVRNVFRIEEAPRLLYVSAIEVEVYGTVPVMFRIICRISNVTDQ